MTKKSYVLDTNVLIHDPSAIFNFEDNEIYIPIYVLEELDKIKVEQSLRGRNAREACKALDKLRGLGNSLSNGIELENGGKLFVYVPKKKAVLDVGMDVKSMDHAILQTAMDIKENSSLKTILVTMDTNLRVRADSLGMTSRPYESLSVDPSSLHSGHIEIDVGFMEIDEMYSKGIYVSEEEAKEKGYYINSCVTLTDPTKKNGIGKIVEFKDDGKSHRMIQPIKSDKNGVMGIKPRNKEQAFALDLLLDDSISLVTIVGIAGTGKTLLACAAGLSKILDGSYTRLIISRPVVPMGKDIGYLPGTAQEKLDPWMQPIYDNLDLLLMMGGKKKLGYLEEISKKKSNLNVVDDNKKNGISVDELYKNDLLKVEPLTYIRGRSIPKQFILIDEAQNLTLHEIKTIITRCGEGSKVVLTGDPEQIDSPYMDKATCGLSVCIEKMRDNPLVGHLTLSKGERSPLATLAAKVL